MLSPQPPHNNGMHPTPRHAAFHVRYAGARVMPALCRFVHVSTLSLI